MRAEDGHARVGVHLQQPRLASLRVHQEIKPEELKAPAFDRHEPDGAPGFAARRRERVRRDGAYALAEPIGAQLEPDESLLDYDYKALQKVPRLSVAITPMA